MNRIPYILALLVLMISLPVKTYGQVSETYDTPGSYTFVVPDGVTEITVQAWGGGGKGGSASSNNKQCGGGGGGAYSSSVLDVIPGSIHTVTIGAGSSTIAPGQESWFSSSNTVMAKGGRSVSNDNSSGGTGGLANDGYGQIKYNGGNGADGSDGGSRYGGGGGSSAGSSANGSAGSGQTGGSAPTDGGDGGNGGRDSKGLSGIFPGGGGGGAESQSIGALSGGAGANGQIIITYEPTLPTFLADPSTLYFGYIESGETSNEQTFTLEGFKLDTESGSITIDAPVNFEVSLTSGSGFTSQITIDNFDEDYSETFYVIFTPPINEEKFYNGSISIEGGGANTEVNVNGYSVPYCPSYGNNNSTIGIVRVRFNTIDQESISSSEYSDYLNVNTEVQRGSTYQLIVNAEMTVNGNAPAMVWFDWNKNGLFTNSGEEYDGLGTASKNGSNFTDLTTINIQIPADAGLGELRMRMSIKQDNNPGSCDTGFNGEVEDYTIIVRDVFTAGAIETSGETICSGGTPSEIGSATDASGGDENITYQWRSSADSYGTPISGASSSTYTPPSGLTEETSYRRYAYDGTFNTTPTLSIGTWTVTVNPGPTVTVKQVTADYECPQLISDYGFNPNNNGPYNPGSSEIMFAVILDEPASDWDFSFNIEAKYDETSSVDIDSVNIRGTHYDLTGTSPYSYTGVYQTTDSVGVHAWVKNIPGEQVKVIFDVSEISVDNCKSTFNDEKRDTIIMNIMPVVGHFE